MSDIRAAVPSPYFERGADYARRDKVRRLEWHAGADEVVLEGSVRGTRARPYQQTVTIRPGKAGVRLQGYCSCPVGFNCKHVAAVLLHGIGSQPARRKAGTEGLSTEADELDPELTAWLHDLEAAGTAPGPADGYPDKVRERLIYELSLEAPPAGPPRVNLRLLTVRLLADGSFSTARPKSFNPHGTLSGMPPRYLLESDARIVRELALVGRRGGFWGSDAQALIGVDGREILERVISTGRCRWQSIQGPALRAADARPGRLVWTLRPDGSQQPSVEFDQTGSLVTLPLEPPCYLDPRSGDVGPIATGLPDRLAATFLLAPPVPPHQAALLGDALSARASGDGLPTPASVDQERRNDVVPVSCLELFFGEVYEEATYHSYWRPQRETETEEVPMARLSFDYGGQTLSWARASRDTRSIRHLAGNRLVTIERRFDLERAAVGLLAEHGFQSEESAFPFEPTPDYENTLIYFPDEPSQSLADFCLDTVPALRAAGWRVDLEGLPFRIHEVDSLFADIEPSGEDWFELGVGVAIDGERFRLVPLLVDFLRALSAEDEAALDDWLRRHDRVLLQSASGDILAVPGERIAPLLRFLLGLLKVEEGIEDGRLRLSTLRGAELARLEEESEALAWRGGDELRALGRRLASARWDQPVALPEGFSATLRPYQQEGLAWLQFLRDQGLGGVLADDMGLGKTIQTLAHIAVEKAAGHLEGPCLIVMPTSLVANWRQEARRFAPNLSVLALRGPERKYRFAEIDAHDLVLTTYALLPRDQAAFLERRFALVVLDEAQFVKNPRSKAAQVARRLDAAHRLCLTGTPMENHLGELWSIMAIAVPGLLGDEKRFRRVFRNPIEKHGDGDRQVLLARRIRPFMLRRTKDQVAAELPDKQVIIETVALEKDQRALYESVRLLMDSKVRREIAERGLARSHIIILEALLKLRQACCDPRLVKLAGTPAGKGSAKLERLLEMLPEMIAEGRRILLFSQFTSMLQLIKEALAPLSIDFVELTGNTIDRETPVARFQSGEVPLFLISLKAGGTGLNLTAADTVVLYDPWWNPAVEDQATDRAHRIGQTSKVFVYKLIAEGTVEEKILAMQERKRALAQGILAGDGSGLAALSEAEVAALLAPLPA